MAKRKLTGFLKDPQVRKILIDTAGENTIAVLKELTKSGEDEKIADKLSVRVSDVRAVLNKLHNEGLVTYERRRDENTGWYYYNWIVNVEKMEKWIKEKLSMNKKRYFELISGGEKYFCPKCGLETVFSFEESMDLSFRCPSCNSQLDLLDEEKAKKLLNVKELA